ncbi:hypothetical protein IFM47457_05436 [Aspergillus lentulus]|nr:hypothetical protein IFM47457_05436 [Aspergillus lentulus]
MPEEKTLHAGGELALAAPQQPRISPSGTPLPQLIHQDDGPPQPSTSYLLRLGQRPALAKTSSIYPKRRTTESARSQTH